MVAKQEANKRAEEQLLGVRPVELAEAAAPSKVSNRAANGGCNRLHTHINTSTIASSFTSSFTSKNIHGMPQQLRQWHSCFALCRDPSARRVQNAILLVYTA